MVNFVNIGAPNITPQQANPAANAATDVLPVKKSEVEAKPVQIPAVEKAEVSPNAEDRRFTRVAEAAKRIITEFYPISDTRFTIFKDGSGQYITRFTNLRDGTVTFYPEREIVSSGNRSPEAIYQADA